MYSSDFKHGKNPFLLQLMLGAALQASNSEYQLCLVRDTKFQASAPDDVFWATLTISNISFWDQLHPIMVKFGETSTNPYSKYFKMFKFIQLKYIVNYDYIILYSNSLSPRSKSVSVHLGFYMFGPFLESFRAALAEARMIIGSQDPPDFIW